MSDKSVTCGWYSYCDGVVDTTEKLTNLCHHGSLDVIVAITQDNSLLIHDANSGKLLQSHEHKKKVIGSLKCVYHEGGMGLAISDGFNFGYRRQSNGLLLLSEALQTPVKSSKENVTIELQHSEATLLISYISVSQKSDSSEVNIDDISNPHVKELYTALVTQVRKDAVHSQSSSSSKWNTLIILLPYDTIKNACLCLLEPYHKYLVDMSNNDAAYRNSILSIDASYGLPIISSILHRLVLLYPSDHPGCMGKVIENPNRSLMYSELTRSSTFTRWPHRRYRWASPKAMAQAGFYHQPSALGDDRALCFACNVCLVCWEPSDEPWSEHERHSPGCPFVCGDPTVNIPLSLTYALQPAQRLLIGDSNKKSYFLAIAQNSGYMMTATEDGLLAMWNINKVSKLVARLRLRKETFLDALKQHHIAFENYDNVTCSSFKITSLCALENMTQTKNNQAQTDDKFDRQLTCMALGAVMCLQRAQNESETDDNKSSSVDITEKTSSHVVSVVIVIKPILKRSHLRKTVPTAMKLGLSEATFYHEAIPGHTDMFPEPDEPLPNGAMTPIPVKSFVPPFDDGSMLAMSDEDTDVQEEDKSNKDFEIPSKEIEAKKTTDDHQSKMDIINCFLIDKIDDVSSFEEVKHVTNMVCDKAENIAILSVRASNGNNGICKLDLDTKTMQFALNDLSILKMSCIPHDFSETQSDCETYNSDNDDLNLSGYESSPNNTQDLFMCLSECGKIFLLEITTLEVVHELMLSDVFTGDQQNVDDSADIGKITSFVYCPSNKICISTNISKMIFIKFGKQAKTPTVSETCVSPVNKSTIADKPLNLSRLQKMLALTKSEVLKPRFICITSNCWIEIPTDNQTSSSSFGSKSSSYFKQTTTYKGLLASAYADVNSQFVRRHFHHPAQHCASDVVSYTRLWRMQPDSSSCDFHAFDIILPRATSISHIEFKFVLGTKIKNNTDVEITMIKCEESKIQKETASKPNVLTIFEKFQHLLTRNIASCNSSHEPILFVEEIEDNDDESAYVGVTLVDGDGTKVYGQLHKYGDKELLYGSLVQVLALMWCEVGGKRDMRIVCGVWDKVDPAKMEGLTVRNMNKPPPLQNIPENQLANVNNKILFGSCNLSEYVDSSGNGGTVVIKGQEIIAQSKIKTFLLHIKAIGRSEDTEKSKEKWSNKGCNNLQEVSITVYKFVKDKPQVNRYQRMEICSNENLHRELLRNLFISQDIQFNLLPAKLAILDLLCWITCVAEKSLDNICQYLNQHFYDFLKFSFMNSDKEISSKSMTLLLLTVLDENSSSVITNCTANYIGIVVTCIEECMQNRVNSFIGLSNLFQILDVLLLQSSIQKDNTEMVKVVKQMFKILLETGEHLSTLDPLYRTLRSKYGLYGFPFEADLFSVDINAARTLGIIADVNNDKNSTNASEDFKHKQWEDYFSKEELNICNLYDFNVDEQMVSKTIYLQDAQGDACLGVLDCLPLHYKAVGMSEGCSVRGNTNQEVVVPSSMKPTDVNMNVMHTSPVGSGNIIDDDSSHYNLTAMLNKVGGLKNYVNNLSSPRTEQAENQPGNEDPNPVHKLKDILLSSFNFKIPKVPTESPYPISLSVTKMHSGARRNVILDFGHVMEINSVFMYTCRDLSSMTIESWVYGDKNGPKNGQPATHFATVLDICDHDFNLKNISPPLVCQYMKISFVGRYGTTNAQTLIRLGRFYGIPACVGYSTTTEVTTKTVAGQQPNVPIYTRKNMYTNVPAVKSAIQKFIFYLKTSQEDCECRYTLAANKLKNIMTSQEMYELRNNNGDNILQGLNNSLVLQAYQNAVNLQIRLVRISTTIQRMQSVLDFSASCASQDNVVSISQLEIFGFLVVNSILSTSLVKGLLQTEVLNPNDCLNLFSTICQLGFPRLRLCTVVAIMQYAAPMDWFGDFISSCLYQVANFQSNQKLFIQQEHLSSLLLVVGHKCLENKRFSEKIMDSLLQYIISLFARIGDQHEDLHFAVLKNLTWFLYFFTNLSEKILCCNESVVQEFSAPTPQNPQPVGSMKNKKDNKNEPPPQSTATFNSKRWNFLMVSGQHTTSTTNEGTMSVLKKIEWYRDDITSKRDEVVNIYSSALLKHEQSQTDGSTSFDFSLSKSDLEKVKFLCTNISKYSILLNQKHIKRELDLARSDLQGKQSFKGGDGSSMGLPFVSISQTLCTTVLKQVVKFLCSLNAAVPSDSVVLLCKFASMLVKWCGLQAVHTLRTDHSNYISALKLSDFVTKNELQQLILLAIGGKVNSESGYFSAATLGPWLKHALCCFIVEILEVESYVEKILNKLKTDESLKRSVSDKEDELESESFNEVDSLLNLPELHKKRIHMVELFSKSCKEVLDFVKKDMSAHGELGNISCAASSVKSNRGTFIKHNAKTTYQLVQKIVHQPIHEQPSTDVVEEELTMHWSFSKDTPSTSNNFTPPIPMETSLDHFDDYDTKVPENIKAFCNWDEPSIPKVSPLTETQKPKQIQRPLCSSGLDSRTTCGLFSQVKHQHQMYLMANHRLVVNAMITLPMDNKKEREEKATVSIDAAKSDATDTFSVMQNVLETLLLPENISSLPLPAFIELIFKIQDGFHNCSSDCKPVLSVEHLHQVVCNLQMHTRKNQQLFLHLIDLYTHSTMDGDDVANLLTLESPLLDAFVILLSSNIENTWIRSQSSRYAIAGPSIMKPLQRCMARMMALVSINARNIQQLWNFFISVLERIAISNQLSPEMCTATDVVADIIGHLTTVLQLRSAFEITLDQNLCSKVVMKVVENTLTYLNGCSANSTELQTHVFITNLNPFNTTNPADNKMMINLLMLCVRMTCMQVKPDDAESQKTSISDVVLTDSLTIHNLLSCLVLCKGGRLNELRIPESFNYNKLCEHATSIADGVLCLACSVFQNSTKDSQVEFIKQLVQYLTADNIANMSETLCLFMLYILQDTESAIKFCELNGLQMIAEFLVSTVNEGVDHNPNVTTNMMQFMTSSYDRLAFTMPLPPVSPDYNGWPPLGTKNTGGSKSVIKLPSGNVMPNPNYSGVVSGAVHPDIKVLTDPEVEGGLVNFALNATLQCDDTTATVPESLIKNRGTGIHRRARAPSWSYHFTPGRTWITLTLQFPKAFVLKSVTVIPMLMALNTSPSYVTVETSSVNRQNLFNAISSVLPTSGLSRFEVDAPTDEVISAVRIHFAKPLSSQSMGLTRITVHGYPTFKNAENQSNSSARCGFHIDKTSSQNNTNSVYWLSLLNHCLYHFSDSDQIRSQVIEQILRVENLSGSLCLLLNSNKIFVNHCMIESVLITTYLRGVKSAETLIPYLLKQTDNVNAEAQNSKVQVLYEICSKQDYKLPFTLEAVVTMLNKIAFINQQTNSNSYNLIAAQLHTIACTLWENSKSSAVSEAVTEEVVLNLCKWLSSMKKSKAFSNTMQMSLQWILCSFVNVDSKYLRTLLMTYSISSDISCISWLAKVCQNDGSIEFLMDNNLVGQLSKELADYCATAIKSMDDLTATANEDGVNDKRLNAIVKFFSELCRWRRIQNWLGTETGQLMWISVIKLLYVCLPKPSGSSTVSYNCSLSRQALLQLQSEGIKLLKALVMFNEANQKLLANVIVELLQSKLGITGFLKLVLSDILLDEERIYISIHAEKKVESGGLTSLENTFHHPIFGTGRNNMILHVPINMKLSEVKRIWGFTAHTIRVQAPVKHNKLQPKEGFVEPIPPELLTIGSTHSIKFDTSHLSALMKNKKELSEKLLAKLDIIQSAKATSSIPIAVKPDESTSSLKSVENAGFSAVKKRQKKSPQTTVTDKTDKIASGILETKSESYFMEFNGERLDESITIVDVITKYRSSEHDNLLLKFDMIINDTSSEENLKPSEKGDESSSSSVATEPIKNMLEYFADIGGLALLASRLSINSSASFPDIIPEINKPLMQRKDDEFEWLYSSVDSLLFEDEEDMQILDDHKPQSFTSSGKIYLNDKPSMVGLQQLASNLSGVPRHTMTALLMFLRLPKYANEFLKNGMNARSLLKILLGVADESEGAQIMNARIAPELTLQPYSTLQALLESSSPSSEEGGNLRNVMVVGDSSMHLLLACYAHFTHYIPNGSTSAGRSLNKLMPEQETVKMVEMPPQKPVKTQPIMDNLDFMDVQGGKQAQNDQLFWAKGTGFGTGSTTSNWNIDRAVKKQKQDEHYVTAILRILVSFISPNDEDDCVQLEAELKDNLTSLFIACGLFSSLSSYLRNDSVLDMASHVPLYQSILMLLRGMARCEFLVELLVETPLSQSSDGMVTNQTENICELLNKMRSCVDRYNDRLKNFGAKASEPAGTSGKCLTILIKDIQTTEDMLNKISESFKIRKEQEPSTTSHVPLSLASLEEKYIKEMKTLQFDTHALVTMDEKGKMKFNVSHNYESHIKSIGHVTNSNRALRLAQEAVTLSNSLPLSYSSTVFVRCDEERLDTMKVLMTGPEDTPYANGCFEFDVFFPAGYNNVPPLVNLQTTGHNSVRFNPNLYVDGKVCLSILNTWHGRPEEKWNPQTSSFLQVLVSIQSLILVSEPYFNEPGYERSRGTKAGTQSSIEYDANIQQATVKWAMLNQLKNPSACFKDIVERHFWMKRREVLEQCERWLSDMKKHVKTSDNRGRISHHCAALKNHLNQLRTALMELKCPTGLEDFVTANNEDKINECS